VTTEAQGIAALPDVAFRTIDGVRIRYADSAGSQETSVLLTSPWPESVYAFAHLGLAHRSGPTVCS
jgi:hypothetical protein